MKTFMKYLLLASFSGYVYVTLELLYRGRSDITMMYCASIAGLLGMCMLNNIYGYEMDISLQIICSTLTCTFIEYIFGVIFNCDYHIWDYRKLPLNFQGQICVPFMLVWMLISIVIIPLMDWIEWKIFNYRVDTPPYYKLFGKVIYKMK